MTETTPSEWLVMEVLAARHRLGEAFWTFPTMCLPTLRRLQERRWLYVDSGTIEKTVKVTLEHDGKVEWGLVPPPPCPTCGSLPLTPT